MVSCATCHVEFITKTVTTVLPDGTTIEQVVILDNIVTLENGDKVHAKEECMPGE